MKIDDPIAKNIKKKMRERKCPLTIEQLNYLDKTMIKEWEKRFAYNDNKRENK